MHPGVARATPGCFAGSLLSVIVPVQPSAPPIAVIGEQPSAPPQQDEIIRSRTKFGFESQLTQCPHCHKQTLSELVCRKVGMVSLLPSVGRDAE
ncbi:hypothetical protein WR25_03108 [Diploscapter pachys]|uniref:Uncharacterized protein n=1 Tax=Diploscapter pachys TaxID=2018661 RepID=A0A2A2JFS3_9BILA|nr:hypothetical protein WR25_03108 [Diploscapter pachys]